MKTSQGYSELVLLLEWIGDQIFFRENRLEGPFILAFWLILDAEFHPRTKFTRFTNPAMDCDHLMLLFVDVVY